MSTTIKKNIYLTVKDHSVSSEEFQLLYNEELDMLETYPRPSDARLGDYYKSDDYISHTDAKRNLFEKVYQSVKSIALKRKLKLINNLHSENKTLLDVGCGTGDFLKTAKDDNWTISGIEPNENARTIANKKTENSVYDIEQLLKFEPGSFDVITLWHVLEHLPELHNHITILNSLLKANGTLLIAVPNFKSFDANHYKHFWAAFDVPRHLWHFSKTAISKLFSNVNMSIIKIVPMTFDSYYVSLLSEKYKKGFMNPFKAFWIGWLSNVKAKRSGEYSSLIYIIKKN
ncbi:class I SAM-dependent methyltransferase [Psychroserpens algicola]|uniref:Class I SAM-dependent methyltransferase n=1 Tax=Psychroserpens algicola TaxID=1719034 RepID=A0ABT0HBL2_9FLAO|nr:class I SAM-dependent methyltransferase [Psychroserpens algicola]